MKLLLAITTLLLATSAFADRSVNGTYEVPEIDGQNFEGLNLFQVRYRINEKGDKIKYKLPLELTGVEETIELTKSKDAQGKEIWEGEYAKGTCTGVATVSCRLEYQGLTFDPERRLQIIKERSLDINEQKLRLDVAIQFASEPIGVITFGTDYR